MFFAYFADSSSRNSSSKKPSVMETLKRKTSDTYLNAAKVSTNISNNNILSSSSSIVHTRGPVEMTPSVNSKCNSQPQQSQQQQQQQTSSVSFYNDQKYLHKKFKRIASATTDTNFTNNNNNNQETLVNNLVNHTKSEVNTTPSETLPVKITENSSLIKISNNNNFSSANYSSHHSIINNNNVNNFKVVQNHTTPPATNYLHHSHKNVPQVMTAYENYIITKEKLTHHQVQQMDAATKMISSAEAFVNSNSYNNSKSNKNSKTYENPPQNSLIFERFSPPSNTLDSLSSTSAMTTNVNHQSLTNDGQSTPGRYVCPFCQLVCTKPSVLEKHIRAHTNERPYPCGLCGFAFKTKSNLHKHFK